MQPDQISRWIMSLSPTASLETASERTRADRPDRTTRYMADTPTAPCRLDLKALMRKHHTTIRQLADATGLTIARIRQLRALESFDYPVYCDLVQAISGQNVFNRARYNAIQRQTERNRL